MKIEKRIIAYCLCAVVIGAAITLPLTYFMPVNATTTQKISPWFNIKMDHVCFSANVADNAYQQIYILGPEFTINFDVFNQQKGAQIEYFEFIYYTDDTQLLKTSYFMGGNSSYIENPQDFITLSRDKWFDSDLRLDGGGCYFYDMLLADSNMDSIGPVGSAGKYYAEFDGINSLDEKYSTILAAIEDQQTIYLDVIRAGYTTFDGNDIVINTTNNEVVIQHIELTKNGDTFMFGNVETIENKLLNMF